jgi:hypothetical protein
MGDFYGYNAGQFQKDYSFLEKAFGTAAKTIQAIPEVVEFEKARQEGKINNDLIYTAVQGQLKSFGDEEFKSIVGEDKKTFIARMKPARNESQEDYIVRSTKAQERLLPLQAKANVAQASRAIGAMNEPALQHQADIQQITQENPELAETMKATGGFPKGPAFATPEQVQKVARGYNVPESALAPEMKQATDQLTAQQIERIDQTGTRFSAMKAIGGSATDKTMAAIGTLPTEEQEATNMINVSDAKSRAIGAQANMKKAEADLIEAKNKTSEIINKDKKEEANRLVSLKSTISDRLYDKQGRLNQVSDDLNNPMIKDDQVAMDKLFKEQKALTREISKLKKDEYDINKQLNPILGTKLNEGEDGSDEVLNVIDQYYSIIEAPDFRGDTAQTIWKLTKDAFKFETNYENIVKALSQGAKPEEIIKVLGKKAGY